MSFKMLFCDSLCDCAMIDEGIITSRCYANVVELCRSCKTSPELMGEILKNKFDMIGWLR